MSRRWRTCWHVIYKYPFVVLIKTAEAQKAQKQETRLLLFSCTCIDTTRAWRDKPSTPFSFIPTKKKERKSNSQRKHQKRKSQEKHTQLRLLYFIVYSSKTVGEWAANVYTFIVTTSSNLAYADAGTTEKEGADMTHKITWSTTISGPRILTIVTALFYLCGFSVCISEFRRGSYTNRVDISCSLSHCFRWVLEEIQQS